MRIFTGSNGDLGKVFENNYKTNTDKFYSKKELDITKYEDIKKLVKMNKNINSFINSVQQCASEAVIGRQCNDVQN